DPAAKRVMIINDQDALDRTGHLAIRISRQHRSMHPVLSACPLTPTPSFLPRITRDSLPELALERDCKVELSRKSGFSRIQLGIQSLDTCGSTGAAWCPLG